MLKGVKSRSVSRLSNITCVYCGVPFGAGITRTREHVIGRNFVPEHTILANDWNLIVWACSGCNLEKSDLEDEISAITLQPELGVEHQDSHLAEIAARKRQRGRSRYTKKPIKGSNEQFSIVGQISSITAKLQMIAPPVILPERACTLARFHAQAFFYLKTYNDIQRIGTLMPDIVWTNNARRSDWGNVTFVAFANLTRIWRSYIQADAANGNFRVVIRRDPSDLHQVWSFAVEWNAAYRVIGFFGDAAIAQDYGDGLLLPQMFYLDPFTKYREEVPIQPENDHLFS